MSNDVQAIVQNLRDAGCDSNMIEEFLALGQEKKTENQLKLLAKQRKRLLDHVHKEERQIYCLDYLELQMKKVIADKETEERICRKRKKSGSRC